MTLVERDVACEVQGDTVVEVIGVVSDVFAVNSDEVMRGRSPLMCYEVFAVH
ncbi:hypothetical protein M758_2G200100 [Ceratodon purpureus]|nr:hypothetical protein M758_2G200100 [Ceratodon purpureus]